MTHVRRGTVSPGRNDPCPCGSGKKYKQCCLSGSVPAGDVTALMQNALTCHQAGQVDAAWELYQRVLHEAPDRADAWYLSALIEQGRGRLRPAQERMARAVELMPDNPLFVVGLGIVEQMLGQLRQAEQSYGLALVLQPDHIEARNNLANVLKEMGRLDEAASHYQLALQREENPVILYNLANLRQETGLLEESILLYERALTLQPAYPEALANLGGALQRLGHLKQAEERFRQAISLRPGYAEAWNNLGNVLKEQGLTQQAAGYYREAAALLPMNAGIRCNLGHSLKASGETRAAIEAYREAVTIDPGYGEAWAALAGLLQEAGELTDAIAAWREAHARMPLAVEPINNLACALHEANQSEQAISVYRQGLLVAPDNAALHYNLASVLHASADLAGALVEYAEALRLQPDYIEALNNLGNAQKDSGDYSAAEASYRRVLALRPDSAEAHCNLAILFSLQQRYEEAEIIYRQALALQPDLVVAHRNLAALLIRAGQMAEARIHMDAAYTRKCWFEERHPGAIRTVLILLGTEKGNVPFAHLFSSARNNTLEWMLEYDPSPGHPQLPAYDLVFNAMGEPDMTEKYVGLVDEFMLHCRHPLMNPPHAVARTARDHAGQLLGDIPGLLVPRVWRLGEGDRVPDDVSWPLLVRPAGSHGGEGLLRVDEPAQLIRAQADFPGRELYLTAWVDCRSIDGWYRKYRVVFINGEPWPYHLAISAHWMVHYATADMLVDWKLAEEQRFLENPAAVLGEAAMRAIRQVGQRLALDFAGADLGVMPDGRLVLFEANATMLVHPEAADSPLAFKNPYVQRIYAALDDWMTVLAAHDANGLPAC